MSLVPYALTRPFLFGLDAERAHDLTLAALEHLQNTLAQAFWQQPRIADPVNVAGLNFPNRVGLAAGLEEKLFQPQGENKKDFYAELPITIRLTGGYHEMGRFAGGIAALPRIVTLHDIEITPAGGKGITDPTELNFNVTAKTYRYLDEEEQAAAPKEDKGKAKKDRKGKKKPAAGEA